MATVSSEHEAGHSVFTHNGINAEYKGPSERVSFEPIPDLAVGVTTHELDTEEDV